MKTLQVTLVLFSLVIFTNCQPAFLKKLAKQKIENANTQADKDQNLILDYAIEKELDVQKTESGIYYTMTKSGEGARPKINSQVKAHYKGLKLPREH